MSENPSYLPAQQIGTTNHKTVATIPRSETPANSDLFPSDPAVNIALVATLAATAFVKK